MIKISPATKRMIDELRLYKYSGNKRDAPADKLDEVKHSRVERDEWDRYIYFGLNKNDPKIEFFQIYGENELM